MNNLLLVPATKPQWIQALLVAAQKPAEKGRVWTVVARLHCICQPWSCFLQTP